VKEPLIKTFVDFLAKPTIELLSFSPAVMFLLSLKSLDVYDPFQIFLQETGSQEIGALISGLVFSGAQLPCYVGRIFFELPSTAVVCYEMSVPPPPSWFSRDASVLLPQSPPSPD